MFGVVLFLHALGALTVGFYLLLPFVVGRLSGLNPQSQVGFARVLYKLNRIGQWMLVAQFLTGGYMISQVGRSVPWMVAVIVVFVAIGAMSGMIAAPLKRIIANGGEGKAAAAKDASKLQTFSGIGALLIFVLLILKYFDVL